MTATADPIEKTITGPSTAVEALNLQIAWSASTFLAGPAASQVPHPRIEPGRGMAARTFDFRPSNAIQSASQVRCIYTVKYRITDTPNPRQWPIGTVLTIRECMQLLECEGPDLRLCSRLSDTFMSQGFAMAVEREEGDHDPELET